MRRASPSSTAASILRCGLRERRALQWRELWSATACASSNAAWESFASTARARSAVDSSWEIDFPHLESRLGGSAAQGAALLAQCLSNSDRLPASPVPRLPVEELSVVLSSAASFAAAVQLLRDHGSSLKSLRLRVYGRPEQPGAATVQDLRQPLADEWLNSLAAVLQVLESAKQKPGATPLESFEIVCLEASMHGTAAACDNLLRSLSSLLCVVSPSLEQLTLGHVDCRCCSKAALLALTAAVCGPSSAVSSLRSLDLHGSPLVARCLLTGELLGRLGRLRILNLNSCSIHDAIAPLLFRELARGVGGWFALRELRLSQCDLSAYGVQLMLRHLNDSPQAEVPLRLLQLSANPLGEEAAFPLASCLVRCHALEHLELRHAGLTRHAAAPLLSSLSHTVSLRSLCVRSNQLGNAVAEQLALYAHCWPALESLDLTRCRVTYAGLPALAHGINLLESLRELRLAGNNLRVEEAAAGVAAVPSGGVDTPRLFAWDPSYMRATAEGKVPTSFELDRKDREAGRVRYRGPEGLSTDAQDPSQPLGAPVAPFAALGNALSSCRSLRVLDMADCCVADASFVLLAARAAPSRLEELRLGGNPLFTSNDAVHALAGLLWGCTSSLRLLDLAFTGLGDWGVVTLCDGPLDESTSGSAGNSAGGGVVPELAALQTLLLSHARITAVGMEALTEAVGGLTALQILTLDANVARDGCADDGVARCAAMLERLASASPPRALRLVSLSACLDAAGSARVAVLHHELLQRLASQGVQVVV